MTSLEANFYGLDIHAFKHYQDSEGHDLYELCLRAQEEHDGDEAWNMFSHDVNLMMRIRTFSMLDPSVRDAFEQLMMVMKLNDTLG